MSTLPIHAAPESCTHVLAEFDCLDPLLVALHLDSCRLKCTSLAVSKKLLALGTSAGGLHLIQREGWKQRLILSHKEGSITKVAFCPHNEDFIAVTTSQGLVVLWDLQLECRGRPERVSVSWEHQGQTVTALCWDTVELRVFVGDTEGKVSFLRVGSAKLGKATSFVIFPVQSITTVESRVVQLDYQEGHLLVSSLRRCYVCDTEREKFWRVGNKERDGEYGACFYPQLRSLQAGQSFLLYCARPGSRMWEASISGDVLSTHQFKQILACPATPLISFRSEPQYNPAQNSPQAISFPRLLCLSDNIVTWTSSAIYIFMPQCAQVLLWTEIKDVVEVAVYCSELFCLHADGHLSHLTLLPVERCVAWLLRHEAWMLASTVCCMFQHAIISHRARKVLPVDRLEHLLSQLTITTQKELEEQLRDVVSKLERLDSASSSRRSSISSHESFNVLDCGIYRVISRRGSQSDEETCSLVSQMVEEECLREFGSVLEEEVADQSASSDQQPEDHIKFDRYESGVHLHFPRSFRYKPPRVALQAVRDSVSSFVKKTAEKINTLQINSDLWSRPDQKEVVQSEETSEARSWLEELGIELNGEKNGAESDLGLLRSATDQAMSEIQDPLVLLDVAALAEVIQNWLLVLQHILCPEGPVTTMPQFLVVGPSEVIKQETTNTLQSKKVELASQDNEHYMENPLLAQESSIEGRDPDLQELLHMMPAFPLPSDLHMDLSKLASLTLDLGCFRGNSFQSISKESWLGDACNFLHHFFFLLNLEHVRWCCLIRYRNHSCVWQTYMTGLLEILRSSPVLDAVEVTDLLWSLQSLREQQPWCAPFLLPQLHRLYEKHDEAALRTFGQFYPTVTPCDIMLMAKRRHFLPYLDNLVFSQPEKQRDFFVASLLQPESVKQEWLELALSHDAPQLDDTMIPQGLPRWRSHLFHWGYRNLVSLLIHLPADLDSKLQMAETCRSHGYWEGYLYLCWQLHKRTEVFFIISRLDDMNLLQGSEGIMPETLDEWKLLIELSLQHSGPSTNSLGNNLNKGLWPSSGHICPESLTLQLAWMVGPERALAALQKWSLHVDLGPTSALICELLWMAEKKQRALIQTMLEYCDRFLWSQHA